jgi:Tfp pilus assembly protein PilO
MKLPAIPKLPQLKPRERLLVAAGAIALIIVAMDRLILDPWLRHARTVRHETQRLEQSLRQYSRLLSRKEFVLAQRERYQRYLRTPLPDELHMAGLLKEMEALAEQSGIMLIEVKPLPPEGDTATRRFLLDVQFECTLEEWADFLIEVESSPSLYQIVRANLTAQDETPDRLRGSIRVASAALRLKAVASGNAAP